LWQQLFGFAKDFLKLVQGEHFDQHTGDVACLVGRLERSTTRSVSTMAPAAFAAFNSSSFDPPASHAAATADRVHRHAPGDGMDSRAPEH
jgi:hypothetical protein